jgi:hypothetical protein
MTDAEFMAWQNRVIQLMPCSCTLRWIKDGAEREVVHQCQRCRILVEYTARIVYEE